jgi:hypothetical protein
VSPFSQSQLRIVEWEHFLGYRRRSGASSSDAANAKLTRVSRQILQAIDIDSLIQCTGELGVILYTEISFGVVPSQQRSLSRSFEFL